MSGTIASSTAIDLSRLPAPAVVETLDYEAILAALRADFSARFPEFDAAVESDPVSKLLETFAYRELLLRQRVNDGARAVMLAYAIGTDLDHLAALFGVSRLLLAAADPQSGTPARYESDDDLRRRIVLAPDSYSVAGPRAAYVFHALTASPDVRDAAAVSPAPGEVTVAVFSRVGDGTADADLIATVNAAVAADDVRPLTDAVTVVSAVLVPFDIDARLTLYPGPDTPLILDAANAALDALLAAQRRLGRDVTRSAIFAALHVGGVQKVELVSPAQDVIVTDTEVAMPGNRSVTVAGYDA